MRNTVIVTVLSGRGWLTYLFDTMEIHVHSTIASRNKNEKKGKVTHPTIAQTNKHIIARDTWIPNWDGGLKIVCG